MATCSRPKLQRGSVRLAASGNHAAPFVAAKTFSCMPPNVRIRSAMALARDSGCTIPSPTWLSDATSTTAHGPTDARVATIRGTLDRADLMFGSHPFTWETVLFLITLIAIDLIIETASLSLPIVLSQASALRLWGLRTMIGSSSPDVTPSGRAPARALCTLISSI